MCIRFSTIPTTGENRPKRSTGGCGNFGNPENWIESWRCTAWSFRKSRERNFGRPLRIQRGVPVHTPNPSKNRPSGTIRSGFPGLCRKDGTGTPRHCIDSINGTTRKICEMWRHAKEKDPDRFAKRLVFGGAIAWFAFMIFCSTAAISRADLYSWTDENGVRHFSNQAPDSASAFGDGPLHIEPEIAHDRWNALRQEQAYREWQRQKRSEVSRSFRPSIRSVQDVRRIADSSSAPQKIKKSRGIFEIEGYQIDAGGHQTGNDFRVRGRVQYGPYCGRLRLSCVFQSPEGRTQRITTTVADVGGSGSRTIRYDGIVYSGKGTITATRELVDANVTCIGN